MKVQCNYSCVIPLLSNNIVDEAPMTSHPVDMKQYCLGENTNDFLSIHWAHKYHWKNSKWLSDSWVAWYETVIPAVILGGLSGTVHLPCTCQAALAQCCSGSTSASAGCLWDWGPITSRWGSLISISGPVKATRLCTVATILSGLAAGLFKVIDFSYTGNWQNKYSPYFFYWGAFGLLHSCLICIVLPCFLLGFLVYGVVRFDCVVLQLIREMVEGEEEGVGWKRLQPTERAEMTIVFRYQIKGGEPSMQPIIPPNQNPSYHLKPFLNSSFSAFYTS